LHLQDHTYAPQACDLSGAKTMQTNSDWTLGQNAWRTFTQRHPELGYRAGHWGFHNFLRVFKRELVDSDAIRLARNRHWIAHVDQFCRVAFKCATLPAMRDQSATRAALPGPVDASSDEARGNIPLAARGSPPEVANDARTCRSSHHADESTEPRS
jgi:hypothetical protein